VIYLDDPETGKPIYARTLVGNPITLSIARRVASDEIATAMMEVSKLTRQTFLIEVAVLAAASLEKTSSPLQSYLTSWAALELFINSSFKATYEQRWHEVLKQSVPPCSHDVLERYKEVMPSKYRLADKFTVIASLLDEQSAPAAIVEFKRLK